MRLPVPLAFLLLAAGLAAPAAAQGFRTFSGRNHPELDWRVARTEHFEIVYPQRLAGIEAEAAAIAEATYDSLSVLLGVTFDRPLRVYLSDEDEIANGIAFNVGPAGFTNVWVHVNEFSEVWTGGVKWLRKVLAHEIAHLFHYRAVRSRLGLAQYLIADPLPSFWTEGLAQYLTERWDAQRGDRWLRTAVFESRLSYADGLSATNGQLKYAVGNSQARYLADTYGDSTLVRLLRHRTPGAFGLGYHHFYHAFRATVGQPYREFYDAWRKHVGVYYHTLAGQMGRTDSLGAPLDVPGQYVYGLAVSPDTARWAATVLSSVARPVRRLVVVERDSARVARGRRLSVVAEGALQGAASWSPDGRRLAYARRTRDRHGGLVNDLYAVDIETGERQRLTRGRRAADPQFDPAGSGRLAFIGVEGATANVFLLNAEGREAPLTRFTGDVQLTGLAWSPDGRRLAASRFSASGRREVVVIDAETGAAWPVTGGRHDDRRPVWSYSGRHLAYTSLRDGVPNVFVVDTAPPDSVWRQGAGAPHALWAMPLFEERVTRFFAGATAHGWLPPDSAHAAGRLVLTASETKRRDRVFLLDAARRAAPDTASVPTAYASWTWHRPPHALPDAIAPDASLVQRRYRYSSWKNITHALTLPLPYYEGADDFGLVVASVWLEPLAKHQLLAFGALSVASPLSRSVGLLQYVNNQLRPTVSLSLYRGPGAGRFYGSEVLVEDVAGGDVSLSWPLDVLDRPYAGLEALASARLAYADPFAFDDVAVDAAGVLPPPEAGTRAEVGLGLRYTFQRPYRYNAVYPLDGTGVQARVTAGVPALGAPAFLRPDVQAYWVSPRAGLGRFFAYGRAQARFGEALGQDYLGLSRYDDLHPQLPLTEPVTQDDAERVRGYRRYAVGDRVLFGTLAYHLPPVFDLNTRVLGVVELGRVVPALFVDGAVVWTGADLDGAVRRTGAGLELANLLRIGGLPLRHTVGVAQRWDDLGRTVAWDSVDLYYRLQALFPF